MGEAMDEQSFQESLYIVEGVTHAGETAKIHTIMSVLINNLS